MDPSARCGIPLAVTVPSELVDRITLAVGEQLKAEGFLNGLTASPLLTVDETASYLRCSRQAVYDRVHQGAIVP
jgi:hypothetical protein